MDETKDRLARCFAAVFPTLTQAQIEAAEMSKLGLWDSVASVTLFATVEEEFAAEIALDDMKDLVSFQKLMDYLKQRALPEQA